MINFATSPRLMPANIEDVCAQTLGITLVAAHDDRMTGNQGKTVITRSRWAPSHHSL